jgi:hypothetical protein
MGTAITTVSSTGMPAICAMIKATCPS